MAEFVRIGTEAHQWSALVDDWRNQTEAAGEVFDEEYQLQPDIFLPLIGRNDRRAGLFAVFEEGHYLAICQLNTTGLPGYQKPVMRVRHITFAPQIDLTEEPTAESYSHALVETFFSVMALANADPDLEAGHMNFHLPSPSDRQFFTFLGQRFKEQRLFDSVASKGAWLYINL